MVSSVNVSTELTFSDHYFITFEITCQSFNTKIDKEIMLRQYVDIDSYQQNVTSELTNQTDLPPSALSDDLNAVVGRKRDEHFPIITKTITVCGTAPWYNGACKEAKLQCRRTEKASKKDPGDPVLRSRYIAAMKHSAEVIRCRKRDYYTDYFRDMRNSPRHISSAVSNIIGKPNEKVLPELALTSPLLFCNQFNIFLYQKIQKIREDLDMTAVSSQTPPPLDLESELTEFCNITPSSFEEIVRKCRVTHCDLDPLDFSKVPPAFLNGRFIDIINATFSTCEFPSSEKRGLIYPRLKSHGLDREVLGNYRPITNVSYLSKLIETAMYLQLEAHVQRNNVLPPTQSAYRTSHSTETAMTRVYSDIISNLDSNLHTIAVYLDLSSAFDSIDHTLLLDELQSIGIKDKALETLKSYLSDRQVQVSLPGTNTKSDSLPLKYGVPQGSVLGPLLFVLYTRRLSTILTNLGLNHHIYADDTQFYCSFNDNEVLDIKNRITEALNQIKSWMTAMKLKLNISKTNFMIFSPKHKRQSMKERFGDLTIDGITLHPADQVKTLGVTLDSELTFVPHIDNVVRSCNFAIHNLYVAREFLPRDVLIETAIHEVFSKIDYCNALFLSLPKNQLYRLQKLINRCARLVFNAPRKAHVTHMLLSLHWLPIGPRIDFKILTLTFKALAHHQPRYLYDVLKVSHRGLLVQSSAPGGHRFADRSFSHAAPALFNKLPSPVRNSPSVEVFKNRLKTFLFSDAFDHKLDSLLTYVPSDEFLIGRR